MNQFDECRYFSGDVMKRRAFLTKGSAGVFALGAFGCSENNGVNPLSIKQTGIPVTGLIAGHEGNGIQGVKLTITGDGVVKTVMSDVTGRFAFSVPGNGAYTLTPHKTGYSFNPAVQKIAVNNERSFVVNIMAVMVNTASGGVGMTELGTTGIMVSRFALGSHVNTQNTGAVRERMVREAIDRGVMTFDVYDGEYRVMGKYLAPVKNDVVISVNISPSNPERDLEGILNYFGRDCIDLVRCQARNREGLHGDTSHVNEWWMWEELFRYKEQGKVRAVGVPIHFPDEIDELIATYPIDFVIFPYNFYHNIGWPPDELPEDFVPFAQSLRDRNIGVITMKPFAGDYFITTLKQASQSVNPDLSFTQAALRYVINSGLEPDTTFCGMNLFNEFIENVRAYEEPVMSEDEQTLLDEVKVVAEKTARAVLPDHYRFLDTWAPGGMARQHFRTT